MWASRVPGISYTEHTYERIAYTDNLVPVQTIRRATRTGILSAFYFTLSCYQGGENCD
jgi:hypothetical protein